MDSETSPEQVTLKDLVPMDAIVMVAVCNKKGRVAHEGRIMDIFVRPGETLVRVCCHRGFERTMSAQYMGLIPVPDGRLDGELLTFVYSPLYTERDYARSFTRISRDMAVAV